MFGLVKESHQDEDTIFYPRSPYGISKVAGFHITRNYREAYNTFACNGILFNHESPRRGFEFVTRKISVGVARIKLGMDKILKLGNMEAKRDWGYAPDFVKAMWLMLQQDKPDDYVIATGQTHTVREFAETAFVHAGLDWKKHVRQDKDFYRPSEVNLLYGNYNKAKKILGWTPSVKFKDLVRMMVDSDLKALKERCKR
jgi:GDPmannose 4,6-dehydratase